MRAPHAALVAITLATAVGHAQPHEHERVRGAVEALPALATIKRGRTVVEVRGEVSTKQRAETLLVADQVIADVQRRFTGRAGVVDHVVTLALLPDDKRFLAVAGAFGSVPSNMGFYRPDHRVAIANLGRSIGNLRHELAHPLLGDDFPTIPSWLNEGLAALYGSARWRKDRFEFLVNYRLKDLQRAMHDGTLPTIAQLAESSDDDVHGDRAPVFYAMGRYVLLYAESQGKLTQLYLALRGARDTTAQRAILTSYVPDKAFAAWAKKLRY